MPHPSPGSGWWVAVRLPCFRLAAALRRTLAPNVSAVLIERDPRRRVLEATDVPAALGVRPGMPLREASRLAPHAAVVLEDRVRGVRDWSRVLAILRRLPAADVADADSGLAFLGVPDGGDPERWFRLVRRALEWTGLNVRCGAGPNRFVAFVAAHRFADAVCRPGAEADFVADAPLALLDLDEDVELRLRLLGVATLGALARLRPEHLVRFGADAFRWHALAHGRDASSERARPTPIAERRSAFHEDVLRS